MSAAKSSSSRPSGRFDVAALRSLAGDTVFERGENDYQDDAVRILSLAPERILARVAGTEDYRTELTGRDKQIGGTCSCPAFDDRGFCKHIVAVALAANAAGEDTEAGGVDPLGAIRDYLKQLDNDFLVSTIMALAEEDPSLFHKLETAAALTNADDRTLEARLRKAIDHATDVDGYIDYRAAGAWADEVAAVLDTLADLVKTARAGLAIELAERVIDQVEESIEEIDDSAGHCTGLLERARDIHLAAVRAAPPDPVELASSLFDREMEGDWGTFDGAMLLYADVLGENGLAEYRRLAAEAWEKAPPRTGATRGAGEFWGDYRKLRDILDVFAEREGDLDTQVALRSKDLSSPLHYLQLAQFCHEHGREDDALRHAEEGLWVFEDARPDERLLFFTVERLVQAGRKKDAQAHLGRAFEAAPSVELYARLAKIGGKDVAQQARERLEAKVAVQERTRWNSPADLLVNVFAREEMWDAAWKAAHKYGVSMAVKQTLAHASESAFPGEAVAAYAERVDQLAETGGNPAYEEAARFVARMSRLQGRAEQLAYVQALKVRYGRKRNFMKLLG